jgi:hypothetical protein
MKDIRALVGKEYGRVYGWDPVNAPMARQWAEVMGLDNPAYADGSAIPPAMLQVWCMEGPQLNHYPPGSTTENPYEALKLIEAHGYPSVVAVNSELEFDRPLAAGERLYYTTRLQGRTLGLRGLRVPQVAQALGRLSRNLAYLWLPGWAWWCSSSTSRATSGCGPFWSAWAQG